MKKIYSILTIAIVSLVLCVSCGKKVSDDPLTQKFDALSQDFIEKAEKLDLKSIQFYSSINELWDSFEESLEVVLEENQPKDPEPKEPEEPWEGNFENDEEGFNKAYAAYVEAYATYEAEAEKFESLSEEEYDALYEAYEAELEAYTVKYEAVYKETLNKARKTYNKLFDKALGF